MDAPTGCPTNLNLSESFFTKYEIVKLNEKCFVRIVTQYESKSDRLNAEESNRPKRNIKQFCLKYSQIRIGGCFGHPRWIANDHLRLNAT